MSLRDLWARASRRADATISAPTLPAPPDRFADGINGFVWRVLVRAYARVLARQQGRDWLTIPDRELHAMLEPYHADLARDADAIAEAVLQARMEGMRTLQEALHSGTEIDHEMLDQSVELAYDRLASTKGTKAP